MLNHSTYKTIIKNMKETWDIPTPIWYPLYETKRSDVISFYLIDEPKVIKEFLVVIKRILVSYEVDHIYKLGEQELGFVLEILSPSELIFTKQHFIEDSFWCDNSLKWIIYTCHDGYITIGGSQFICELKGTWTNWEVYKSF
ncbi:CCP domain-containing protein [Litchfieldia salsa]|uniref:CCP domain-containing protein n=1 Tax=Litchfieldia salsa TaxID=930152 RepID=UPI000B83D610|nr:CCP domain-containing protein [Litchfieldia salsa]